MRQGRTVSSARFAGAAYKLLAWRPARAPTHGPPTCEQGTMPLLLSAKTQLALAGSRQAGCPMRHHAAAALMRGYMDADIVAQSSVLRHDIV